MQLSRLGMPLVNEVVIGLPDKISSMAASPKTMAQFLTYVTNPTLPRLLEIALDTDPAFGGTAAGKIAPKNFPRTDLVSAFLTGITGLNRPANVGGPVRMMRLNTAIAGAVAMQNRLGVAGELLRAVVRPASRKPSTSRAIPTVVVRRMTSSTSRWWQWLVDLCVLNTDNDLR